MPRRKRLESTEFAPLKETEKEAWEDLIKRSKEAAGRKAKSQFDLILLAGEVETKYGDKSIRRWAEETGISYTSARQYRWLFNKGCNNKKFFDKYGELGYTVIRDVVSFCGGVHHAEYYLQYALKHKLGPMAINAFMREAIAPTEQRENAAAHKLAVRMKQGIDGFSDDVRAVIERTIEEHPELETQILEHKIVKSKDLEELLIQAGVKTDAEQAMVDRTRRTIKRIHREYVYYRDNEEDLIASVEYDHEASQELWDKLKYLRDELSKILEHKPIKKTVAEADTVEVPVKPKRSRKKSDT